jgi:hypothetical protein
MYKIVDYEKFESHPKLFSNFKIAFMIQQLSYPESFIEDWSNGEAVIVWSPN